MQGFEQLKTCKYILKSQEAKEAILRCTWLCYEGKSEMASYASCGFYVITHGT